MNPCVAEDNEGTSHICNKVALFFKDGAYMESDISGSDLEDILDKLHLNADRLSGIFIVLDTPDHT